MRRQPGLGLAGITLVIPVALLVGAGLGSLERSLIVLGPITTFALPVVAMIAFWWAGWPGARLRAPMLGITDTLLVIAGGVLLTIAAQAVVDHIDLRGVFDPDASPAQAPTFPGTMVLGGAIFTAMLQLTLVSEGWPLGGLHPVPGGVAALGLSWAVGTAIYLVLVGPLSGAEVGSALVCIGALQVVFYVVLMGWPFSALHLRALRLPVANAVVIAGGCLTHLALTRLVELDPAIVTAVAGSVVAAGLTVGMLFEGWLDGLMTPADARAANLTAVALITVLFHVGLRELASAAGWTRAEPEEWTSFAALNAIGAGIILHVAIGRRWPFAPAAETPQPATTGGAT